MHSEEKKGVTLEMGVNQELSLEIKTKQDLAKKLQEKQSEIKDTIKSISELKNDTAKADAAEMHSINNEVFTEIDSYLSQISANDFILCSASLNQEIAELIKIIDKEFAAKVTKIAEDYAKNSLLQVDLEEQSGESKAASNADSQAIEGLRNLPYKFAIHTEQKFRPFLPFNALTCMDPTFSEGCSYFLEHLEYSIYGRAPIHWGSRGRVDSPSLFFRLLSRVPSGDCSEGKESDKHTEARKAEQKHIEIRIQTFCNLLTFLSKRMKEYRSEDEARLDLAKRLNLYYKEVEQALTDLKKEYIKGAEPSCYKARSKALDDMLSSERLAKLLGVKEASIDLAKRKGHMNRLRNLLVMPSAIFSASCLLSSLFNIMPGRNPLLRLSTRQVKGSYLLTASVFSAYLILYTVRYALPKKSMDKLILDYDKERECRAKNLL